MTSRKAFLGVGVLAAVVPALVPDAALARAVAPASPAAPGSTAAASDRVIPPLAFDVAAFDAMTGKPAAHRNMFASTKLAGGDVLSAVKNTLDAYALIGQPVATVSTAVVLYHGAAVALAFNDAVWRDMFVPAIAKMPPHLRDEFAEHKHATGNPFLKTTKPHEASLEPLAKGGTMFFVCKNATEGVAYLLSGLLKRSPKATYDAMVAGLVPGATLVPAGVWAVHALQERHYTYLQSTL